jgi:hypothetical protein
MHAWYIVCAQAKKNFFVKFIDLICSIQNSFKFFKSDENWAQLQALKLRFFDVLIFWCSWCSSLAYLCFFLCVSQAKKFKYVNEEHQEHQKIRTSKDLNFKACNWAQFSSDLQNSNEFWMLRIRSMNFTKKKFFLRARMQCTMYACNILLYILNVREKNLWKIECFQIFNAVTLL